MSASEDEFTVLWTLQFDAYLITAVKANLPLSFRTFACGFVFIADLAAFGLENSKIGFHKISFLVEESINLFNVFNKRFFTPLRSVQNDNYFLFSFLFLY